MKAMKKVLALALALAMVVTAVPVTSAKAADISLKAGKSKKITYYVGKTNTVNLTGVTASKVKSTTWSKNGSKALNLKSKAKTSVKVQLVKAGTAKVTASVKLKSGKTKKYTVNITVKNPTITAASATTVTVGDKISVKATGVKPASATVEYSVADPAIATVDAATGVVTGVKAGTTKVTAKLTCGTTVKEVTTDVTVKDAVATLASVKQTASNAFTATFTADASKTITKDDIKVTAADGSIELAVKSVEFSADGLSANVTVFGNFANTTAYKVSAKDVTLDLTALVGDVARIQVDTDSAQQNVETNIKFRLFDANGIDVTPSVSLDSTCTVNLNGSYSAASIEKASTATVTMNTVGDKVEVTVTYNSNANGAQDVTTTATITCVDAKATQGTKLFATTGNKNSKSDCAKFYLGLSDSTVYVTEGYDNGGNTFFCAKDSSGDVISYDSYEVESANDDIASASLTKDSGKYAQITVAGNTVGNTQLNIKATKNGKDTYYTIPVAVTKTGELASMNVNVTVPTISNVNDSAYTGAVEVKLYDKDGNRISGSVSAEVITTVTTGTALNFGGSSTYTTTDPGHDWDKASITYNAQNAVEKTYTIKVTGADTTTGKTIVRNVSVSVKDLMGKVTKAGAAGLKLTYQISISNNIDENPADTWDDSMTTSLYATYNGLFAGYVRNDGSDITVAQGNVTPATAIDDVELGVKFGTKVFKEAENLYGTGAGYAELTTGNYQFTFDAVNNTDGTVDWKADGTSADLAKAGTYTVVYQVYEDGATKAKEISKVFTVKNSVVIPTVAVTSRTADSLDFDGIQKCLKTNVDMNNDTSDYASITGLVGTGTLGALVESNNKMTIKNAVVEDTYGSTKWNFYVSVNATFKTE